MDMLHLTLASLVLHPGLDHDHEQDDDDQDYIQFYLNQEEEEDGALSDTDYELLKAEDMAGFLEKLGPVEHEERLALIKTSFGIPSEPEHTFRCHALPEGTRDKRHVGDRVWHEYYYMSGLLETDLPAMRYTQCNDPRVQQCFHEPTPILQIFNVKVQTSPADMAGQVEVYGIVAVRDDKDKRRNYLFNRSRENPLDINLTGGFLRLLSPRRGMSMQFNCLIEVDIRVKGKGDDDTEDITLADGCMELIEGQVSLEMLCRCTMSGPHGSVAFDYIIFRFGFEATIELDFLEVPERSFSMQMCGYSTSQKNYYTFIDKNCDCDSVVSSTGRFPQQFVAAVQMDDYFLVDFAEGKSPLIFKPSIHGSEAKEYSFCNGALVSVKVSWSTAYYCS